MICYNNCVSLPNEAQKNEYRGVAQLVARSVRDAEVVGSIPVASTKNTVKPCGYAVFFCFYVLRRGSRVGAVLQEQNALPNGALTTDNLKAKDDVDNVGAGRAAKSAIPVASTKNTVKPCGYAVFFCVFVSKSFFCRVFDKKQLVYNHQTI